MEPIVRFQTVETPSPVARLALLVALLIVALPLAVLVAGVLLVGVAVVLVRAGWLRLRNSIRGDGRSSNVRVVRRD